MGQLEINLGSFCNSERLGKAQLISILNVSVTQSTSEGISNGSGDNGFLSFRQCLMDSMKDALACDKAFPWIFISSTSNALPISFLIALSSSCKKLGVSVVEGYVRSSELGKEGNGARRQLARVFHGMRSIKSGMLPAVAFSITMA